MGLAFVDVTWTSIGTGLGLVAIAGLVLGTLVYNWRKGGGDAGEKALRNWKELAESETAKNVSLMAENIRLKEQLSDCEQLKNDFAQHVLRATARERRYQMCINNLERAQGLEVTNFDEVGLHSTEDPRRR